MTVEAVSTLLTYTMLASFALAFLIPSSTKKDEHNNERYKNKYLPIKLLFFILGVCNLVGNVAVAHIISLNDGALAYLIPVLETIYIIFASVLAFMVLYLVIIFLMAMQEWYAGTIGQRIRRGYK